MTSPTCPYCKKPAEAATGADIYPHRPDLADKRFYRCVPCGAYVGTHVHTGKPFGTLANATLRRMRNATHQVFDPFWLGFRQGERRKTARTNAYAVLAKAMNLHIKDCHIGMFTEKQCLQAIEICTNRELFKDV